MSEKLECFYLVIKCTAGHFIVLGECIQNVGFLIFNKKLWTPRFMTLENVWGAQGSWLLGNKKEGKKSYFLLHFVKILSLCE